MMPAVNRLPGHVSLTPSPGLALPPLCPQGAIALDAPPPVVHVVQVWKLSSTDLCEIARSGVLHSGFPHACKKVRVWAACVLQARAVQYGVAMMLT